MLNSIIENKLRIIITNFLGTPLIENSFFYFDLYSIIHIIGGIIVMFLIIKVSNDNGNNNKPKNNFIAFVLTLLIILTLFEIFEHYLMIKLPELLRFESTIDVVWDIIYGSIGGIGYYFIKFRK